ncbi:MAG TPA: hypothetical protein VFI93_09240 [Rhizomicrobium sp.]|nr:hypothetical protein [Rhizomicrobium sp.]
MRKLASATGRNGHGGKRLESEGADIAAAKPGRDTLGHVCFALHFAVMLYLIFGWLAPVRGALFVYLAFVPGVMIQWQFNKNACVLNNLESLIRYGQWRHVANTEEGGWFAALVENVLGLSFTRRQVSVFIYVMLISFWLLALGHLLRL